MLPSFAPLQLTLTIVGLPNVNTGGSMIVRVVEILQLFASLAMIVYVPADKDVKLPEGKYVAPLFLEYSIVPVPPEAPVLMLPLPAPLQVILVCEADVHVNIGGLIN